MTEMPKLEDRFYDPDEVAKYFGVTSQTVRLWLKQKDTTKPHLNGTKFGRGWRITRAAIIEFGNQKYS